MLDKDPRIDTSAEEVKSLTPAALAEIVKGFVPGKTVIDIAFTDGRQRNKVLFNSYDVKRDLLHYSGVEGRWPNKAQTNSGLLSSVRESV